MERLQKIISKSGAASRREAERLIAAGRVTLNGKTVTKLGVQAQEGVDVIEIDGQPIGQVPKKLYFLLNKPKGFLSTVKDDRGRKTIIDLLEGINEYVYPIGRLDFNTEGLILLTNDGELMNSLLHPSYEINKNYIAKVEGVVTEGKLNTLRKGVMLEDGLTAPAQARLLSADKNGSWSRVSLTIHEGRNRQVRRMMQAVGHQVITLKRNRFAGLTLEGVALGKYRELSADEVAGLRYLAGNRRERK